MLELVEDQEAVPMIWVDHVRYPISLVDDMNTQIDLNAIIK